MRYSEAFKEREDWDPWEQCVHGSMGSVMVWGRDVLHCRIGTRIPLGRKLPKSWRAKVRGLKVPELWLRYYAALRHFEQCMVLCSDYANQATNEELPIVRDRDLDLELLLAHARLVQETGEVVRKEGYVENP